MALVAPSGGKASVFTALSPDSAKSSESQEAPTGAPPAKASRSSTKASETAKHPSGSKLGGNLWACAHAWYPVCYFQFITYSIIALRAILFFSDVSIRLPPEPYYCVICRLSVRDKEDGTGNSDKTRSRGDPTSFLARILPPRIPSIFHSYFLRQLFLFLAVYYLRHHPATIESSLVSSPLYGADCE